MERVDFRNTKHRKRLRQVCRHWRIGLGDVFYYIKDEYDLRIKPKTPYPFPAEKPNPSMFKNWMQFINKKNCTSVYLVNYLLCRESIKLTRTKDKI